MAIKLILEVPVTVNTDEQAELIIDSVNSGLAETAIKDRVLFGATGYGAAAVQPTFASKAKTEEAAKTLKPVEVHTPKKSVEPPVAQPKERAQGVLGRRRLGRTGRNSE